jgi:hypothetical protein
VTIMRTRNRAHESRSRAEGSPFDTASERLARGLASRFTRRSFFGEVGRGGVALALGGTVVGVDRAYAACQGSPCGNCTSCASETNSIRCDECCQYTNDCPPGSCSCGWWDCNNGPCNLPNGCTRWHDCCGGCDTGSSKCFLGDGGICRPHCCNRKAYCAGDCGTKINCYQGSLIKCRVWRCPPDCNVGATSC